MKKESKLVICKKGILIKIPFLIKEKNKKHKT